MIPAQALLTPDEMQQADHAAPAAGVSLQVLMEHAGRAVAQAARRFGPCRTLVLCGPGNNGGDGYVAARLLAARGWPVQVAVLAQPGPGTAAAVAAAAWRGATVPLADADPSRAGLVIDALFGAGLARDVDGPAAEMLRRCAGRSLLAVDIPSGVDGLTGQVRGFAPQADATVTFVRPKPGHMLLPGRTLCGRLHVADIGMPAAALAGVQPRLFANGPGVWQLPVPRPDTHKFARGVVTVIGGAEMTGAARMSATAARRAGAGMVLIQAEGRADLYRAGDPGLIVLDGTLDQALADSRRDVWVVGPGLGAAAARIALPAVLAAGKQVVADADALSAHAGNPAALRGAAVLTPHEGEFSKLFGAPGPDKVAATRAAARDIGCVVLLKGADTVVAAPDGRSAINDTGIPALATAGAGDVLSGVIAALLAQGMPPFEAACAGAWLHGQAARLGPPGLIAEDLPSLVARAMADMRD